MTIDEIKEAQAIAIEDVKTQHHTESKELAMLRVVAWEIALQLAIQTRATYSIAADRGDPR